MENLINILQNWISERYIDIFAAISGFVYIYFSIRQKIWLWPVGIITSTLFIVVFFKSKFYADMSLQMYYVVISFYGWYLWLYGRKEKNKKELAVSKMNLNQTLILSGITIAVFSLYSYILKNHTDSVLPFGDAFTTAISIAATWMLAKKKIENWLVWIVANSVSMSLYIYKEDLLETVLLTAVYAILSIVGYFQWKKKLSKPVYVEL